MLFQNHKTQNLDVHDVFHDLQSKCCSQNKCGSSHVINIYIFVGASQVSMTSHALKLILLFVEFCDFPGLPFTNSDCQIMFIVFF